MTKVTVPAATSPAKPVGDDDEAVQPARADSPRFAWPAPGKVRRGFAPRAKGLGSRENASAKARTGPHDGIDIAGAKGDPVRAAAPGLVWYAGKEPNLYGNVVIIDHGKGWFSAYAKLSRVTVKKGETVRTGERVGLIGDTGSTPTTELHFEIRRKTVPLDPLKLLPERK
jgi:murein DD-endopeptidase MepM/ murein hydrolase activator NlpD